ncbi:CHAP domain-containing protein [Spirosoma aerolatum]|uniref:CHAP domain-containing protein n=1 Tax=Spirosoma aerolatum TaxID=1211326 RepID=UPI0009ACEF8F|nr:CHAP domain-containing protein [Spirosoma aerolatum]
MSNLAQNTSLIPKVVEVAKRFIGEKETGNNAGFADLAFQKEMQTSGFMRGMSWCALFVETVFRIALLEEKRPALWKNIENLFSASAIETLTRFKEKGYTVRQTPQVGDLAIWRHGPGPAGHIGIVVDAGNQKLKTFTTIEGNTNLAGSREGDGVFLKTRTYGSPISNKPGTFNLLGFVAPVS